MQLCKPDPDTIHERLKEYDKAIVDYSEIIRINPKRESAYLSRGAVYRIVGKKAESIRDYQRALKLNPDSARAKLQLQRLGIQSPGVQNSGVRSREDRRNQRY